MKNLAAPVSLVILTVSLTIISICYPSYLNDENGFLKGAVNHELLAVLGFVVALTLGKAGDIHVELNRIQDQTGKQFKNTRKAIKRSYQSLIVAFLIAGVLVVVKPNLVSEPVLIALVNSLAIILVYFSVAVLYDITATVFGIPPAKDIAHEPEKGTD